MVMKIWNTDAELDLNTLGDNYGIEDDVIVAATLTPIINRSVYTYEGDDVVYTTRLHAGSTVSIVMSSGDDRFYGGSAIEFVFDASGNDYNYCGGGADILHAGTGDDYYHGGVGIDTISFRYDDEDSGYAPEGIVLDLAITTRQDLGYFDFDVIRAFENVIGTDHADIISGNAVANVIEGGLDNDILNGRAGNDMLYAGRGSDRLIGGLGQDTLDLNEGAAARDSVVFAAINESGATLGSADIINNFDKGGGASDDKIDLSAIDASTLLSGNQSFTFLGTGPITTSSSGEIRLLESGANTYVYVDNDADVAAEMIIRVNNVTGLTAADFIL